MAINKILKKISVFIVMAVLCVLLTACESSTASEEADRTFYAMNTVMRVTAYGKNAEQAVSDVQGRIIELEKLWSVTDEDSEIYAVDHGRSNEVSAVTRDIVKFALDISERSSGALDPTIYPVLSAWGFTGDGYRVPSGSELAELLMLVDHKKVNVTEIKIALEPGMMLDLGSVAKGYASDEAARILRKYEIDSALINLGGNIMTVGGKTDSKGWRIGVQDPRYPEGDINIGVLTLTDCAAVTSGNYERYFTAEDGMVYGHIIDPGSGYPVDNDLLSSTIISPNGLLCDALSTAVFVMGSEKAEAFWREHSAELGGFDMLLITKNGEVLITNGIKDRFSLSDKSLVLREISL